MKHKHADVIKAWADGAIIQYKVGDDRWLDSHDNDPLWDIETEYRIKPEHKIYVVKHIHFDAHSSDSGLWITDDLESKHSHWDLHLKVVIDGETGKLQKAEVL